MTPLVEALDTRVLLSWGGVGPELGQFVAPASVLPRGIRPAVNVDPHRTINHFLGNRLGPGIDRISRQVELQGGSTNNRVAEQVLAQKTIHSILSRRDTYTLLNSVQPNALAQASTGGTTTQETVTYQLPDQARISILGQSESTIEVLATTASPGFLVNVPTSNIRVTAPGVSVEDLFRGGTGTGTVAVPRSLIPADGALPANQSVSISSLSDIFTSTGPVLLEALQTGLPQAAPNAPRTVPGLRLVDAFSRNQALAGSQTGAYLRAFRVAADRKVFTLSARQADIVSRGFERFVAQVAQLDQSGAFDPAVPAPAPALPSGRLNGTLQISLGVFRDLTGIDPTLSGFQLPGIGNFPGRIDVGYVFDRAGNYGVTLTARGPLASAPAGVASANVIGGDIRVEVSDAPNLAALNGRRSVEGLIQGSPSAGALEASRYESGISTFAASAGYGAGFEFGTGTAYTQVIPLGNVYALVPEFPGRR